MLALCFYEKNSFFHFPPDQKETISSINIVVGNGIPTINRRFSISSGTVMAMRI